MGRLGRPWCVGCMQGLRRARRALQGPTATQVVRDVAPSPALASVPWCVCLCVVEQGCEGDARLQGDGENSWSTSG